MSRKEDVHTHTEDEAGRFDREHDDRPMRRIGGTWVDEDDVPALSDLEDR